jgi:hypothetical protein
MCTEIQAMATRLKRRRRFLKRSIKLVLSPFYDTRLSCKVGKDLRMGVGRVSVSGASIRIDRHDVAHARHIWHWIVTTK